MPILFSAVGQERDIVANHAGCEGNFMEILQQILQKIPGKDEKITYSHGYYLLHYINEQQRFYFCITDKTFQRSRAFLFLNEIKREYKPTKSRQFSSILAEEMARYSDDNSAIIIRKGELDELNNIIVASSESILGEKMLLVNNPEKITFSTITFVGEDPQQILPRRRDSAYYLIFLAASVFILWLIVTNYGPSSLVLIACVIVYCLKQFTGENKSKMSNVSNVQ